MSRALTSLFQIIILLTLPLLLILGAVRVLTSDSYLAYEYGKQGFPADPYGFDRPARLSLASANFRYVREALSLESLASLQLDGQPLYNERELGHMQDVQGVYQAAIRVGAWAAGLAALGALVLGWKPERQASLARAVRAGGLITFSLVGSVGLLALAAWRLWFVGFHEVFFAAGTWTFPVTNTLIRLFPERFWVDATLTILALSLTGGLLIGLIGHLLHQRWTDRTAASAGLLHPQEILHGNT